MCTCMCVYVCKWQQNGQQVSTEIFSGVFLPYAYIQKLPTPEIIMRHDLDRSRSLKSIVVVYFVLLSLFCIFFFLPFRYFNFLVFLSLNIHRCPIIYTSKGKKRKANTEKDLNAILPLE